MNITFNALLTRALGVREDYRFINKIPNVLFLPVELKYIEFVHGFSFQYGARPTLEILTAEFPYFRKEYFDGPMEYAVDIFINTRRNEYIKTQLLEVQSNGQNIYDYQLLSHLTKITTPKNVDQIIYSEFDRAEHFELGDKISFGIKWFDDTLGGLWSSDYNIIFGSLANGKTTLLLYLMHMLSKYQKKNILVFSNEMPKKTFVSKLDSLRCGINPKLFRTLAFSEEQKHNLLGLSNELRNDAQIIVAGALTHPNELLPVIESQNCKIDIVAIDGLHIVGKGSAQNIGEKTVQLGEVSRAVRLFTLQENMPVIAVAQGNRGAAKTDSPTAEDIGLAYSMMQDVDNAVTSAKVEVNGENLFKYNTAKNRYNEPSYIYAKYDWEKMEVSWRQDVSNEAALF